MSQGQGVKPKYNNHYFANGWQKESAQGVSYVSAKVGSNKAEVKMWVSINGQEPQEVQYFAMTYNKPKLDENTGEVITNPNAPSVSFSYSTKE